MRKNFRTDLHEIVREGWQWAGDPIRGTDTDPDPYRDTGKMLLGVILLPFTHVSSVSHCMQLLSVVGSRPSDHYFRSVFWFVCLIVCLCRVFSAVFDPISIKLGHMLYIWV